MKTVVSNAYSITIYIAGDLADARRSLRQQCVEDGLCVTLTPTEFVYTAGLESGVSVGIVNYPRFLKTPDELYTRALSVTERLMFDLCQHSALIDAPDKTTWLTRRPEDTGNYSTDHCHARP